MSDELQLWYSRNHRSEGTECREDGAEPHKQSYETRLMQFHRELEREPVSVPKGGPSWQLELGGLLPGASVMLMCGTGEGMSAVTQEAV